MIIRLDRIEIRTLRVLITDIQRISSYQRKTTFVNKFPKSFPFDNSMLFELSNGDKEIRTPDPLLARQVLSQLSYTPISRYRQNCFYKSNLYISQLFYSV